MSDRLSEQVREFRALIWRTEGEPGIRVAIMARSPGAALAALEERYGKGTVYDLHSPIDAAKPRGGDGDR